MDINIVGRKVTLRDNFKNLATKKLQKFERIFDQDAVANVTVTLEKNSQKVEITVKQRGMIYRAEDTQLEMNDALDMVISKLSRQIRKNKTKLEKNKKMQLVDFVEDYYDEPEEEFNIVKVKRFAVKVMTVDEAILQMNLLGHEFFVYKSDTTGTVSVVYKRKDGNYGVLEPEE